MAYPRGRGGEGGRTHFSSAEKSRRRDNRPAITTGVDNPSAIFLGTGGGRREGRGGGKGAAAALPIEGSNGSINPLEASRGASRGLTN